MHKDIKAVAKEQGFPISQAEEFIIIVQDSPYITAAGLQFKMLTTYGAGKYAVQAHMPTQEEYNLLRRMMGLKDDEHLVVMRGEVWIDGFDLPFVDYGTTTPKNLKGFIRFSDYPLEMAVRRATNRAMRLATATGLCSVDEIAEAGEAPVNPTDRKLQSEPATPGQIDLITNLARSPLLTEEHQKRISARTAKPMTKAEAGEAVDKIKVLVEAARIRKQPDIVK